MILDIHLEAMDDKGEKLERLAKTGRPFVISPVPVFFLQDHDVFKKEIYPPTFSYSDRIVDILKEMAKEPQIEFGQQGFAHYCTSCYEQKERRDPWHENACLYNPNSQNEEPEEMSRQESLMSEGKRIIEEKLERTLVLYVPPNHQFNGDTLSLAKNHYRFFASKGMLNLQPYQHLNTNMTVLPERKLNKKGEVTYTHYDQLSDNFQSYLQIVEESQPLSKIKPEKISETKISINDGIKLFSKRLRDLKKLVA